MTDPSLVDVLYGKYNARGRLPFSISDVRAPLAILAEAITKEIQCIERIGLRDLNRVQQLGGLLGGESILYPCVKFPHTSLA